MIISVHQPQYIPWLGYFDKIAQSDIFVFLDTVQYKTREFQNRNKIRIKTGWIWLSVPIVSSGLGRQRICDIQIDNSTDWQRKHHNSLVKSYSQAPFFKQHCRFFENLYADNWDKLIDLNIHIIKYLLETLNIKTPLYYESELKTTCTSTDRIIEICRKLNADTYLSGSGGKDYLEEEKFAQAGIKLKYQHFAHPTYSQRYMQKKSDFLPYMSAIDLIFNEGENSINILRG